MEHSASVPVEVPIHRVSALDFDDAFSDGDDHDNLRSFSSDIIRADLARNLVKPWVDAESPTTPSSHFEASNSSVSTLDMNGNYAQHSLHSVSSVPQSPDDSELSSHFSFISLSASSQDIGDSEEQKREAVDDEGSDLAVNIPYPNIVIDASESPLQRVSMTSESVNLDDTMSNSTLPDHLAQNEYSIHPLPVPMPSTLSMQIPHSSNKLGSVSTSSLSPAASQFPSGSLPSPSSVPDTPQPKLQPPQKHRLSRSMGPSALEKVRSRTRPSFLPPKSRQEDDKHMADWESMMKLSRAAADKRRKALDERRLAREKNIEDSLHLWEKDILPDWRAVYKNPTLRKFWWRGIPSKLRAPMWEHAVGNALALSKDHYRTCFARAKRALISGTFPEAALTLIEQDVASTLPGLHIFHHETGPLYGDLKDMLCAWVVSRSDEGLGYTLGAAKIAAMLLINMPVQQGFVVMRNLLERHCMRSFFGGDGAKEDVEAYYRIFDTLLADGMPKIYFNFKQHQISPAAYLRDWLVPLFLDHLPFEACARLWDVLLLEGDSFLYRAALGILAVLEPRLFFPERKELLELLKGENKAALNVARREGRPTDGSKYEIYGVDEETLWERIDNMDDWWKESTWTRLIQRELPDL